MAISSNAPADALIVDPEHVTSVEGSRKTYAKLWSRATKIASAARSAATTARSTLSSRRRRQRSSGFRCTAPASVASVEVVQLASDSDARHGEMTVVQWASGD